MDINLLNIFLLILIPNNSTFYNPSGTTEVCLHLAPPTHQAMEQATRHDRFHWNLSNNINNNSCTNKGHLLLAPPMPHITPPTLALAPPTQHLTPPTWLTQYLTPPTLPQAPDFTISSQPQGQAQQLKLTRTTLLWWANSIAWQLLWLNKYFLSYWERI